MNKLNPNRITLADSRPKPNLRKENLRDPSTTELRRAADASDETD